MSIIAVSNMLAFLLKVLYPRFAEPEVKKEL
jgi:hypothetical protein